MNDKTYILQLPSPLEAMASLRTYTFLVVIILLQPMANIFVELGDSKQLPTLEYANNSNSIHSNSIIDTPSWSIGDSWEYDGYLDVSSFVASSGASTSVDVVYGTLDRTVTNMYLLDIENSSTLVYEVISEGAYQTNGAIEVEGQTGCLYANIQIFEIVLASDLSTYSQEAEIQVFVDPALIFGICLPAFRIDLAELTVKNVFNPPMEWYDFPMSVGESWTTNYSQSIEFSGNTSDLITIPIPENTTDENSTSWEVVSRGFSGVTYTGCLQSYNITSYDRDGNIAGFRWYCPAIRGDIKTSLVQSFGFTLVNELVSYNPTTRETIISIELENPLSPLDIETSAWINVTNNGQPVSDKTLQFRYEKEEFFQNITTNQDGSAYLEFNSGDLRDNSEGNNEYGSHGILAWIVSENLIGTKTIVIDPDVFAVDLTTSSSGVTVSRIRENNTLTLNPSIGFNAVSGDSLVFSIPVINRGVQTSPPSIIEIQAPDGNTINGQVPALSSLEEARVELNWTIPSSQEFGNISLSFEVDPSEQISEDGNRSNNLGIFSLYIGALPLANLSIPSNILTLDEIFIDGTNSSDPDGGMIICDFTIIADYGFSNFEEYTSLESDCSLEWAPTDDGIILISMSVIDEENDQSTTSEVLTAINRPPTLIIGSDNNSVEVLSPVTFRILNVSDLDSNNPSSPVDILWKSDCAEGQVGITCTVIPTLEGEYNIEAVVTDDDGEMTTSNYSVNVSNIAPYNPLAEVWLGSIKLIPDNRGVYSIQEGDNITLFGQASDSLNDISSLTHFWKPNAESFPNLNFTTVGEISRVTNFSYNNSGIQLAILIVTDNNGEETEPLILPIQVENYEPEILPLPQLPQFSEDELIEIVVDVVDTYNDIDSLIYCYDLNPSIDTDEDGAAKNDCDVNSNVLIYSWPDATNSPESIIFHVSDNDNSTDFIEIPIDIVNTPPVALASANSLNPTEGDKIILSANGTVDSVNDLETLIFHWDLDITVDSDGDGNPSNDIDKMGRWIEASYESEGLKQVKLTVIDESYSHSVEMEINVENSPTLFNQDSTSFFGLIVVALISLFGYLYYTRRIMPETEKVSNDDEFDIIDFDENSGKKTDTKSLIQNLPDAPDLVLNDDNLDNENEPNNGTPDENERLENAGLDIEDIEALFE